MQETRFHPRPGDFCLWKGVCEGDFRLIVSLAGRVASAVWTVGCSSHGRDGPGDDAQKCDAMGVSGAGTRADFRRDRADDSPRGRTFST